MPKYLFTGTYGAEAVKGLLREGGTTRRAALEKLVESSGGRLEAFYFAFGADDVCAIVDLPSNIAAAALGLAVAASGAVAVRTTVLLTPEEIDEAASQQIEYRPPGQ